MLDPLSVTGACVGLISSIVALSLNVSRFSSDVRDARTEMAEVRGELSSLQSCVENLQEDMENPKVEYPPTLQRSLVDVLQLCNTVTREMTVLLEKYSRNKIGKKLQWAASGQADMGKLRSQLNAHKATINIALEMVSIFLLSNIKQETSNIREDTAALKEDTEEILEKIAELSARLPQPQAIDDGRVMILQRFLEQSTTYADTVHDQDEWEVTRSSRSATPIMGSPVPRSQIVADAGSLESYRVDTRPLISPIRPSGALAVQQSTAQAARVGEDPPTGNRPSSARTQSTFSSFPSSSDLSDTSSGERTSQSLAYSRQVSTSLSRHQNEMQASPNAHAKLFVAQNREYFPQPFTTNFEAKIDDKDMHTDELSLNVVKDSIHRSLLDDPIFQHHAEIKSRTFSTVPLEQSRKQSVSSFDQLITTRRSPSPFMTDELAMVQETDAVLQEFIHAKTTAFAESSARSDDPNLSKSGSRDKKPSPNNQCTSLEKAAKKFAQESFAKVNGKDQEHHPHYGGQSPPQSLPHRIPEEPRRAVSQVSIFQDTSAVVDTEERQSEQVDLVPTLPRHVDNSVNVMDNRIFSKTGKMTYDANSPSLLDKTQRRATLQRAVGDGPSLSPKMSAAPEGRPVPPGIPRKPMGTDTIHSPELSPDPSAQLISLVQRMKPSPTFIEVKELIDQGADPNTVEQHGLFLRRPVLHLAIKNNTKREVVELLLDRGARVNSTARFGVFDRGGQSALRIAVACGKLELVKLLVDRGANVNAGSGKTSTAVETAIEKGKGNSEIVRLLLDRGAKINRRKALYSAAQKGHLEVVRLLLDRGADEHAAGVDNEKALEVAAANGHVDVAQLLLDRGVDANKTHALYSAAENGKRSIIRLLLDRGVDVNAAGGIHGHALQAAVCGGKPKTTQMLLDRGADVNAEGGNYGHALQAATRIGHTEIARLLLERQADVNAKGGNYGTAMKAAAYSGHSDCVRLLLDWDAKVDFDELIRGVKQRPIDSVSKEQKVEILAMLKKAEKERGEQPSLMKRLIR